MLIFFLPLVAISPVENGETESTVKIRRVIIHDQAKNCQCQNTGNRLVFITLLLTGIGRQNTRSARLCQDSLFDRLNVRGLLTLGAFDNFHGHLLYFLEALEPFHLDGGKMSKKLFAALIGRNETKALDVVKPLDHSLCHIFPLFICWFDFNFIIFENIFVILLIKDDLAYNMEKGGGNMIGELNIYSCYSFQNSTILIQDLCKRAKELHMEALALTDINNMYGAIEFSNACHHYDIKPIFGMQGDVLIDQEVYPFLFYAKDQIGYHDLMKICSDINLSERKAIVLERLSLYREHVFILSGCKEGIVERLVLKELESEALKYIALFKKMFKDNYYICTQTGIIWNI